MRIGSYWSGDQQRRKLGTLALGGNHENIFYE